MTPTTNQDQLIFLCFRETERCQRERKSSSDQADVDLGIAPQPHTITSGLYPFLSLCKGRIGIARFQTSENLGTVEFFPSVLRLGWSRSAQPNRQRSFKRPRIKCWGIFAKFYPLKSTRGAWVGRLVRHPCSTWYPFTVQASPTSQVSAKDRPQSSKNGQSTSHPANIGGCQWMRGLALKIQVPRLSAEAQTLLAVWWDLTRPPVHCVDGEHCGNSMASREGGWKS